MEVRAQHVIDRHGARGSGMKINVVRSASGLQLFRRLHEIAYSRQQTARSAAIKDAMIETQSEIGFGRGHELVFGFFPARGFASRAHSEHERLFG